MANTIKHKRGSGSDPSASDLVAGELAIRTDNGAVFTKKDDGTVVQVTGASVGGADGVDFNDDVKARFGTGNDLEIYHDGSNSFIQEVGAGELKIASSTTRIVNGVNSETLALFVPNGQVELYYDNAKKLETKSDGIDVTGEVQCDSLDVDGVVDITGNVTLHANLDLQDDDQLNIGSGNDFTIRHDGTHSIFENDTGHLYVSNYANDQDIILRSDDGSGGIADYFRCDGSTGEVKLYYYGSQKLNTNTNGVNVTGEVQCDSLDVDGAADITGNVTLHANLDLQDDDKILLGSGDDLEIYHDGSNSYIKNNTGVLRLHGTEVQIKDEDNNETLAVFNPQGSVDLYYDNAKKLATKSDGVDITGELQCDSLDVDGGMDITGTATFHNNIHLQDNDSIYVGTNFDLAIYHDNSNSVIQTSTSSVGDLQIISQGSGHDLYLQAADDIFIRPQGGETGINVYGDGAVELYFNNARKLYTKSDGVDITGELQSDSLDVDGAADISGTLTLHSHLDMQDNDQIKLGSSDDYGIYHDGNNTFLDNYTGSVVHRVYADNQDIVLQTDNGSGGVTDYLRCDGSNGELKLYHYGTEKLKTQTFGVDVTGEVQCDSLDVDGAGDFTGDVTFRGGASAVNIAANSDIRLANGDWTGNTTSPKIQAHSNALFIAGGSGGIIFRENDTNRAQINGDGHFIPSQDNTYDLGTTSNEWRNAYFDGTVNCDGFDVDGNADIAGQLDVNRVIVRDNGSSSPIFAVRTDDDAPWALNVGNDTYSSSQDHGVRIYQQTDGTVRVRNSGNSAWEELRFEQQNGGTTNTGIKLTTSREVELYYQGSEKLTTKSDGVDITGELQCDSLDVDGAANITGNVDIDGNIRHNGDTNTFFGFPSNDNFRIGTGGTERFRITSTGAIAIEGSSNYGTSGQVLTSNGNDAPSWQDAAGGKILQVVGSTQLSAPSNTTSTSTLLYNATTVSITPTASSSKILFMYSQGVQVDVDNDGQGANNGLIQFEYKIGSGSYTSFLSHRISARGGNNMSSTDIVTVSPNTTSTVTFRVGIRKHEGGRAIAYTNIFGANAITLMEIAG